MKNYIKILPRAEAPWTIPALCAAYSLPTGLPPGGAIGIVELGGGWHVADVNAAFLAMGLPTPVITDVSVDGTLNTPGTDADAEVALDIQVAGGVYAYCTGRPAEIRVYWSQTIEAGVQAALHQGCAVCSISWGAPEGEWGVAGVDAMNRCAVAATKGGMTVFAAAGDNDSDDGARAPTVDCPACCPQVIACGGTTLVQNGTETVWNNNPGHANGEGTGGGFSQYFPIQPWQKGAPVAPVGLGRMVPDVAANADPNTGYTIILDGATSIIGGTSAVAPFYAGLVAALWGKAPGWITPEFYANPGWFHGITSGNNGTYSARVGPDPCTGMGSPNGAKFKK